MADFSLDQMPAGMADRLAALKRPVAPSPAAPPAAQRPASPLDQMPAGMAARLAAVQQPSPGPAVAPPARRRLGRQRGGGSGGWFRGGGGWVGRGGAGAEDWFAGKQRSQP